jgi:hypothetical protein
MCNQAVGLIQGSLEQVGIATVGISLLPDVTKKVRPPRTLSVPFRFGYPLGNPHDRDLQRDVILSALGLLERTDLPVFEEFRGGADKASS